eukprot:evm.model.scf_195.14 EVM.evm.TU.scf_195.14   scf_195:97146-100338(-)
MSFLTFECRSSEDREALRSKLAGRVKYFERVSPVLGAVVNDSEAVEGVLHAPFRQIDGQVDLQNLGVLGSQNAGSKSGAEATCNGVVIPFPQNATKAVGLDRIDQERPPLDGIFDVRNGLTGCGVHVYVADTGVNTKHVEFRGRIRQGQDFTGGRQRSVEDENGHGTHCAGIASGSNYGVAKGSLVHPVKVLDSKGIGTSSTVLGGLAWVLDDHLKHTHPSVLSLSLASSFSPSVNDAMELLYTRGILIVVAAGNFASDACAFSPASSQHVLTVGASEIDGGEDVRAGFSNYGSCIDMWAPGTNIRSSWIGSDTATNLNTGTSMAAPHVAGKCSPDVKHLGTAFSTELNQLH